MNTRLIAIVVAGIGLCLGAAVAKRTDAPPRQTAEIEAWIEAAQPGETVTVPAGHYTGRLTISKPIVLVGEGMPTIDGGGDGDVVIIEASHVTIRGFRIIGSGISLDKEATGLRVLGTDCVIEDNLLEDVLFGIDLRESHRSVLRGNTIFGKDLEISRRGDGIRLWESDDCLIENNHLSSTRDAILWYCERAVIRGNRMHDGRYGLHFMYSHDTLLTQNELVDNSVGLYIMYSRRLTITENFISGNRGPSGYGIGLKDDDSIVLRNNVIVGNRVGIYLDNTPFSLDTEGFIDHNVIGFNDIGMALTPLVRGNVLWDNAFLENTEQIAVLGRGSLESNEFSRDGRGNYWTDYAGYDIDGNGIGDVPYKSVSLFESLMNREPKLRLFAGTPAEQAIEFAGRAMPEMRPEPKFTDPVPLMTRPTLAATPRPADHPVPMAALGVLLVVMGAGIAIGLGRAPYSLPTSAA